MMDQKEIISFFNRCAPTWDAEMIKDDRVISEILNHAEIGPGKRVLDVACGTGVLIPYYLSRNTLSVTGIDISPEMIRIAEKNFPQENVRFVCRDVETYTAEERFDCVMVYNAFPHFPDPDRLIAKLCTLGKPGGTVTVAHGMSREKINRHHSNAMHVSKELMSEKELSDIFRSCGLEVKSVISDENMYLVTGKSIA